MSRLLEHEAKRILDDAGIVIPRGVVILSPDELDGGPLGEAGPFFVKAQIAAGDRANVGGVVRTGTLIEAKAAAARMLGSIIARQQVETVLVEEGAAITWEGYAAVSVAENPPRRVLYFSREGGAGFDPSTSPIQLSLGLHELERFTIRRELRRIGIASEELEPIASFLVALVRCATQWHAYTLETNPVTFIDGAVVALDAKADLDDYSKPLIPEPAMLDRPEQDTRERAAREYQRVDHRGSLRYVQLIPEEAGLPTDGTFQVATHSVGGGESMVVLDALAAAGLSATNYCDTSGSPPREKVQAAAKLVSGQSHAQGLLFSTCIANQALSVTANGLVAGWDEIGWDRPTVVRFAGNEAEEARAIVGGWLKDHDVPAVILGEEADEWDAAAALASLLGAPAATKLDGMAS